MTSDATNVSQRHRRRYLSGTYNSIDEIANPDQYEDSTQDKWREYIVNNKLWVFLTAVVGLIAFILLFRWIATTAGNVLSNLYAQITLVVMAASAIAYYTGRRHQLAVFTQTDEFVADGPGGPKRFFGEYVTDPNGENERFEAYKGFTRLGNPTEKLKVGDLSAEWARKAEYRGYDPDQPAAISIHRQLGTVAHNDFGTIVSQLTDGIEPLEHGGKSVLNATIPDMTRKEDVPKLKKQLEEARESMNDKDELIQTLREQRDAAQEEARQRRQDILESFTDHHTDLLHASRGRRRRSSENDGVGPSREPTEDDLGTDIQIEN